MSKLGLNKGKPPTSAMAVIAEEPPDKRRKMDIDEVFDDDFDIILTQNMNQLDSLVASSCLQSNSEAHGNTDHSKNLMVVPCSVVKSSSTSCLVSSANVQPSAVPNNSARLVGRGSSHSRSMDFSTSSTSLAATTVLMTSGQISCADQNRSNAYLGQGFCTQRASKLSDTVSAPLQKGVSVVRPHCAGPATSNRSCLISGSDCTKPSLPNASCASVPMLSTGTNGCTASTLDMSSIAEERDYYKTQLSELQKEQYSKDGQIKILRDKFNRSQAELSLQKQETLKSMERRTEEKSRKEQELQQESDRLRTELQFKEHELGGLRDYLKKLERKLAALDVPSMQSAPVAEIPKSPSSSRFVGQFDSLTAKNLKTSSPQKASVSSIIPAAIIESRVEVSGTHPQSIEGKRPLKMRLSVPNSKGRLSGPGIVSKLLNKPAMLNDPLSALNTKSVIRSPKSPNRDISKQSSPTGYTKSIGPVVQTTSESSRLSSAGFHLLLASESSRGDSACQSSGLLASDNKCAVLLLPQIEDALRVLQPQHARRTTPASSSSQSTSCSTLAVNSDSSESVQSLMSCLCRLHVLVCSCRHVRIAIIGDGEKAPICTGSSSDKQKSADLEPKSSVSSADSAGPAGVNVVTSRFNPCIERVMRNCQLMDLLISLANPVQDKPWLSSVACICLDILVELVSSCSKEHLNRFQPLIQSELIVNCLTDVTAEDCDSACEHFRIVCSAIKLLGSLIQSREIFSAICSIGQECALTTLFNFCTIGFPEAWNSVQVASCCEVMLSMLSSIISRHADGATVLLRPSCQCGAKIIQNLILILRILFDTYSSTSNCAKSFLVLRKGLAVLHSLAVAADVTDGQSFTARCSLANTEYLTSMFGIVHLFQKSPISLPDVELNNIWNVLPACLMRLVDDEPEERFDLDAENINRNASSS